MKDFLALIGLTCMCAVGIFIVVAAWWGLRELIDNIRYNYRVKHRFDKPPTAKCYCRDCTRHNNKSQECYKFKGWRTADSWFCWDAEPRKKENEE